MPDVALKSLLLALVLLLGGAQYRLWIGDGSLSHLRSLHSRINEQQLENMQLYERKQLLAAEVHALKNSSDAIEGRARKDLGMIKKGETFFMILPPEKSRPPKR